MAEIILHEAAEFNKTVADNLIAQPRLPGAMVAETTGVPLMAAAALRLLLPPAAVAEDKEVAMNLAENKDRNAS
jgi:hypothetical protein